MDVTTAISAFSSQGSEAVSTAVTPRPKLTTQISGAVCMGCPEDKSCTVRAIPCEVYSRVVGYYRPVDNWNAGKQAEFKARHLHMIDKRL